MLIILILPEFFKNVYKSTKPQYIWLLTLVNLMTPVNCNGRMDDFSVFDCSSPFNFFKLNFIPFFLYFIKYYHIKFGITIF